MTRLSVFDFFQNVSKKKKVTRIECEILLDCN